MNKDRLILAVGAGSLLLGVAWVFIVIYGLSSLPGFTMIQGWFEILISASLLFFFLFFLFLFALPGGLAIYHGVSLLKRSTRSAIKGAVGAAAVMATMAFWSGLLRAMSALSGEVDSPYSNLLLMITCLIMLWLYIVTSRALIARVGLGHARFGDLIGKGTALLFALLLWMTCDSLIELFAPLRIPEGPGWNGFLHFVSIFLAWGFYKLSARFLDRHQTWEGIEIESRPD